VIGQRLAFGLPLVLTTPIALSLVIGFLSTVTMSVNGCDFKFPMWDRDVTTIQDHIADYWFVLVGGILSYLSLLLVTNHIWTPRKKFVADAIHYDMNYCNQKWNPIEIFTKYSEICKLGIQNIIVDRRAIFLSCAYK
jgi:hypothetical protein